MLIMLLLSVITGECTPGITAVAAPYAFKRGEPSRLNTALSAL